MKIFAGALSVALLWVVATSAPANAQTNSYSFTNNQMNTIMGRNSASVYSAQQYMRRAVRSSVPKYNYTNINATLLSPVLPKDKPFSNVNLGPSVTPYLNLGGLPTGGVPNYYSLVRPQLDQQRVNERQQQANVRQQRELQSVAARAPFDLQGTETMSPTGHPAVFQNTLGYFPGQQRRR